MSWNIALTVHLTANTGVPSGKPKAAESTVRMRCDLRDRLDRFFASVEPAAFRLAHAGVSEEQDALDLVQDAMLRFTEKYQNKADSEWRLLFFTILNNRLKDHYRRQAVRKRLGPALSLFQDFLPESSRHYALVEKITYAHQRSDLFEPEEQLHGETLRRRIQAGLQKLSARQRSVFLLREIESMSVADTARITGCSEGSVKKHHFRARQSLRALLQEEWRHER